MFYTSSKPAWAAPVAPAQWVHDVQCPQRQDGFLNFPVQGAQAMQTAADDDVDEMLHTLQEAFVAAQHVGHMPL